MTSPTYKPVGSKIVWDDPDFARFASYVAASHKACFASYVAASHKACFASYVVASHKACFAS